MPRKKETGRDRWERSEEERIAASGRHGRTGHRCPLCRGVGRVPGVVARGGGKSSGFGTCPECDGNGYVDDEVAGEDDGA